jgi:diadenosine tetraphosphate (Ap4A) HIT family hydrolase
MTTTRPGPPDPVEAARAGTNPTVLHRLPSGWAVLGDVQRLPGYCLLLHDGSADHLHDLAPDEATRFLRDMALLGRAVAQASTALDPAFLRVNYAILGNAYGRLHAHVQARYSWEEPERRSLPVWNYPDRAAPRYRLGAAHEPLRRALTDALQRLASAG